MSAIRSGRVGGERPSGRPITIETPKRISRAEQETVILWDEAERVVTIWSASPTVLRKLHRLGLMPTSESRRRDGALHGREYQVPLEGFRWGLKRRRSKPPLLAENTPRGMQSEGAPTAGTDNLTLTNTIRPRTPNQAL